jgi:hypothetical protein
MARRSSHSPVIRNGPTARTLASCHIFLKPRLFKIYFLRASSYLVYSFFTVLAPLPTLKSFTVGLQIWPITVSSHGGPRSTGCCFVHIACLFTWEGVSSSVIIGDWSSLTMEDDRPESLLHANTAEDKIPFGRTPARLPGFEGISDRTGHLSVHGGGYQIQKPGFSHSIPRKPVPTKSLTNPTGSELTIRYSQTRGKH